MIYSSSLTWPLSCCQWCSEASSRQVGTAAQAEDLHVRLLRRGSSIRTCVMYASNRRTEDLGLFMQYAANGRPDPALNLSKRAIESFDSMMSDGVTPAPVVLEELMTNAQVLGDRFVHVYSDDQLCVLVETLRYLETTALSFQLAPIHPMPSEPHGVVSDLVAATSGVSQDLASSTSRVKWYSRLREAVQHALETHRPSSIDRVLRGEASAIRAAVLGDLSARRPCQLVAEYLVSALDASSTKASIPPHCIDALSIMATTDQCLSLDVIEELQTSPMCRQALVSCIHHLQATQITQLMQSCSQAAMASLDPRVLCLWSLLRCAVDGSSDKVNADAQPTTKQEDNVFEVVVDDGTTMATPDQTKEFAATVQSVFDSSSTPVTPNLRSAMQKMHQQGEMLDCHALRELCSLWNPILQAM